MPLHQIQFPPMPPLPLLVGLPSTTLDHDTRTLLHRGVAGVVLFSRNFESPKQLQALTATIREEADRPLLIATDHEGGRVQRFTTGFTSIPTMREIGQRDDEMYAAEIAATIADELLNVGVNVNLAPVLDVDTNPLNPVIADRSLGSDPATVARLASAMIRAMQTRGIAACGKHFPGHGDTTLDSHTDLPTLSHDMKRLEHIELPPFRAAIDAGVQMIMTAHILLPALDPDHPATMSPTIITGLLRERLGFEGVIVSDDLDMAAVADRYTTGDAALRSLRAGVDLLLICQHPERAPAAIDSIEREADNDPAFTDRLQNAASRVGDLLQTMNLHLQPPN